MEAKRAIESKTLWFNGVVAVIAVIVPQIEMFQNLLPASIQPYIAGILFVGNIILRFRTSQPVTLMGKQPE